MSYSNNWEKTKRLTARTCSLLLAGSPADSTRAVGVLRAEELQAAEALQFLVSAPLSLAALRAGTLQSLGAKESRGEVVITGRVRPDDMQAILGVSALRVIMPTTRLAHLVLLEAHQEDHRRDVRDCITRSRRVCWIPQARAEAKKIVSGCLVCRRQEKKTPGQ